MGYIFLIVAPIAIALLLLCLCYPSSGIHLVRPFPRTYSERITLLIPWVVFWGVLAANAFLPITAQFPFVMFVPPALPTLDASLEQWLAFGTLALVGGTWLVTLILSVIIALRHVWADRDRWMMGP